VLLLAENGHVTFLANGST